MTATDELRRLLDERGVEWMPCAWEPQTETFYKSADGVAFIAMESTTQDGFLLRTDMPVTPAQAIATTLGDNYATRERHDDAGTCHDKNGFDTDMGFECTACGAMTDGYMVTTEDTGHYTQFNFCPNCGARVVGE